MDSLEDLWDTIISSNVCVYLESQTEGIGRWITKEHEETFWMFIKFIVAMIYT